MPYTGSPDRKKTGYSFRHPLVLITIVAIGGAVVALYLAASTQSAPVGSTSAVTTLLSNVIVFLASGLLSYFITYANDRRQFLEDIEKLARFSRRRVDLLSESLLSLSQEVGNITTAEEAKRLVVYTLRNLEQDARASVRDIEGMGGIHTDEVIPQPLPSVPTPEIPVEAEADVTITYNCPNCGYSNPATLGLAKGSTRHVGCANCRARISLHRLQDRNYKVVDHTRSRLSDYASTGGVAPPLHGRGSASGSASRSDTKETFECPRCHKGVTFTAIPDQRIVEKPCFSCLSVVSYDRGLKKARLLPARPPIHIPTLDVSEMECLSCKATFSPRKFLSGSGRGFICCFACNTVYLDEKDKKAAVEKPCPSNGCSNILTFRLSDGENEARQFCLECTTRVIYHRDSDAVDIIEKLNVLPVDYLEFVTKGRLCPHCGAVASERFKTNQKGQRLSICWGCKDVFEFT